jgi:hypothetical protein
VSVVAVPEVDFEVVGAAHKPYAAAPTILFTVAAREPTFEVLSMALTAQVMIDPARRGYDPGTRERLAELFGPPASWTPSTQGLAWARVTANVPGFSGETRFTLELPCTYDLEVAAAKYLYSLLDGVVPLSFHLNGTVFYLDQDRVQMVPLPWTTTAQHAMPVSVWRAMIAEHYPGGGWIRLGADTLEALNAVRADRGLTFDVCIRELLDGAR